MEANSSIESVKCGNDDEKDKDKERCFTFFVDDEQFKVETKTITGIEIMNLAGIPREIGLLFIADDGSQETVPPKEIITLERCKKFRKAPRFRRG